MLWSRSANDFTAPFPVIAVACALLLLETLVDGELVALDRNGRVSFESAAEPPITMSSHVILRIRFDYPTGQGPGLKCFHWRTARPIGFVWHMRCQFAARFERIETDACPLPI